MSTCDKLILVDADGVLLDWGYAFEEWMKYQGFPKSIHDNYNLSLSYNIEPQLANVLVKAFNESARMAYLPPYKDAMKYVKKLHEDHGYVFHCITSIGIDPYSVKAREFNLRQLFGKTIFEAITCLPTLGDKDEALEKYRDSQCWFIEDNTHNVVVSSKMGIQPILLSHNHNRNRKELEGCNYQRVNNWRDIYTIITGE